ncbi:GGDEF domain-containing protein [Jiella marina]|uniref:GGDEF domain-containing protein n=1 Tax=Jiella sp. LLJ827 TaxID=2917712 RepID=UPI0021009726|nr:GGDEF domain-containing protein [Jiella sp. LLJ827]MCQ0988262.1 GGDEF domain-containing protein [Jiella sp. LLJ827]
MIRRWWTALRDLDRIVGFLLFTTCALAILAGVTIASVQRYQQQIETVSSYNLTYVYTRTQIEIMKLAGAIRASLLDEPDAATPTLKLAIVKGRISSIPISFGPIDMPEAAVARENLRETLETIAPLLDSLAVPGNGELALALLDRSISEFTRLTSLANVRQSHLTDQQRRSLSATTTWLCVNLLLLCLNGIALLWLVFRQKRRLRKAAVTDALTGLANRAAVQNWKPENARSRMTALAVIDVDHFKYVNDHFGHDVGDDLLRSLANVLELHAGSDALAARLGGDEFVLIFTGSDAPLQAERRCAAIDEAFRLAMKAAGIAKVTLSIGIAAGQARSAEDIAALMKQADGAMYASKRDGAREGETRRRSGCLITSKKE